MGIIEDFAPYKDEYGLIHPEIGKISGNGIRYTCEYYWAIVKNHWPDYEPSSARVPFGMCEPIPGLLIRHPSNPYEQEGPDDYVARISIPDEFAKRFLEYGRAHGFVYDNLPAPKYNEADDFVDNIARAKEYLDKRLYTNMTTQTFFLSQSIKNAYLGRQRQIICHAMWAAGEKPDLFLQAWWIAALMQSAFSRKQDSKILGWYLVKVAKGKSALIDSVIAIWKWKFKQHYPHGVGEVLEAYFGFKHPSAVWLQDEFGD